MKKISIILISLMFICVSNISYSQITLDKVINKTEKKTNKRVEKKIDKTIDKGLDKTEDAIDNSVKSDKNKSKKISKKEISSNNNNSNSSNTENTNNNSKTIEDYNNNAKNNNANQTSNNNIVSDDKPKNTLSWNKYDFVPGTEVIFEDNLIGEKNGEFPSKWDLVQGQFENAIFNGENVIYHIKCNMNGGGGIIPMIKNSTEDYLPDEFTIEFDAFFEEKSNNYVIYFADYKNQLKLDKTYRVSDKWIRIAKNNVEGKSIETQYYPGFKSKAFDKETKWRHVAISFNKRALKVYLDDARVLNIPNLGYNPTGFTLGYQSPSGTSKGYTKNFRIAKGAVPLYDKLLTDGKIVTNGIRFDVNKASIKPESMGVINDIVKIMTEHPELNFSVEGHTDSDGDETSNLKLSELRAKAVMDKMIELGITSNRLKTKGWGESKPISSENTTETKANNRRVEFVKF